MRSKKISFVFFGTPDVASETLEILKQNGYVPQLIITAPDRPVGRHFVMTPPAVKTWAIKNNIPVIQPEKITPGITESLPVTDFYIVVAYGKILQQSLIDRPRHATINIHYSLLPKYRGASPVEAAILAGDSETGVSIQKMVFELDAGPIIAEQKILIEINDTTNSLRRKLIPLGANLLVHELEYFLKTMNFSTREQNHDQATRCGKIKKTDGLITLHDDPEIVWRKYRAYFGWPGIYFINDTGKRTKITQARYEPGRVIIEKIVEEGKKEIETSITIQ